MIGDSVGENVKVTIKVKVKMTPAEYEQIRKDAEWEGCSVATYLKRHALGQTRRGC